MFVKNAVYYHLHKENAYSQLWMPGNQIDFTQKRPNKFFAFYSKAHFTFPFRGEHFYPNKLIHYVNQPGFELTIEETKSILGFMKTVILENSIFLRETVFEEVRSQYFPGLPSRKNCIWVFEEDATSFGVRNSVVSKDFCVSNLQALFMLQTNATLVLRFGLRTFCVIMLSTIGQAQMGKIKLSKKFFLKVL